MKHWRFSDSIYHYSILLMVGEREECEKWLQRNICKESSLHEGADGQASHWRSNQDDNPLSAIWVAEFDADFRDLKNLAHECLHVALVAMEYFGVLVTDTTLTANEPLCYYHTWLMDACGNRLFRWSEKRKAKPPAFVPH